MQDLKPHAEALPTLSIYLARLGIADQGDALIKQVRMGIAFTTIVRLAAMTGFTTVEVAKMVGLSRYALRRGRRSGRLSTPHSDRFVRVARVLAAAYELFEGDQLQAIEWLTTPRRGLSGYRPIEMLATGVEADAVLDLIGRTEHGVVS